MTITRVETLTYGVDDLETCARYLEDWGLEKRDSGPAGATFATLENQLVHLRRADDPSLPTVPESGPTMREALWGVDTKDGLEAIAAELSKDRDVTADPDGTLHSRDETGFAIGFTLANRTPASVDVPSHNVSGAFNRINKRVAANRRARPIRIGHIVYLIPEEGKEEATVFYRDRLKFRVSDRMGPVGEFQRCEGAMDHHSLFLMWIRKTLTQFDHAAYELPDIDDVFVGGLDMKERGWKPEGGPGRQATGSHVQWHFHNPAGGTTEYFTDMDKYDETWTPGRGAEGAKDHFVWQLETI